MARQIATIRMTFKVTYVTKVFSNRIFRTAVEQLTRFQLTQCIARSLCDSCASCFDKKRTFFILNERWCTRG